MKWVGLEEGARGGPGRGEGVPHQERVGLRDRGVDRNQIDERLKHVLEIAEEEWRGDLGDRPGEPAQDEDGAMDAIFDVGLLNKGRPEIGPLQQPCECGVRRLYQVLEQPTEGDRSTNKRKRKKRKEDEKEK